MIGNIVFILFLGFVLLMFAEGRDHSFDGIMLSDAVGSTGEDCLNNTRCGTIAKVGDYLATHLEFMYYVGYTVVFNDSEHEDDVLNVTLVDDTMFFKGVCKELSGPFDGCDCLPDWMSEPKLEQLYATICKDPYNYVDAIRCFLREHNNTKVVKCSRCAKKKCQEYFRVDECFRQSEAQRCKVYHEKDICSEVALSSVCPGYTSIYYSVRASIENMISHEQYTQGKLRNQGRNLPECVELRKFLDEKTEENNASNLSSFYVLYFLAISNFFYVLVVQNLA